MKLIKCYIFRKDSKCKGSEKCGRAYNVKNEAVTEGDGGRRAKRGAGMCGGGGVGVAKPHRGLGAPSFIINKLLICNKQKIVFANIKMALRFLSIFESEVFLELFQ